MQAECTGNMFRNLCKFVLISFQDLDIYRRLLTCNNSADNNYTNKANSAGFKTFTLHNGRKNNCNKESYHGKQDTVG